MRQKDYNEVFNMICKAVEELRKYSIRPLCEQVGRLEGLLQCAKGRHGLPKIEKDKTECSRCGEILGKIVSPNAVCKPK